VQPLPLPLGAHLALQQGTLVRTGSDRRRQPPPEVTTWASPPHPQIQLDLQVPPPEPSRQSWGGSALADLEPLNVQEWSMHMEQEERQSADAAAAVSSSTGAPAEPRGLAMAPPARLKPPGLCYLHKTS